MPQEVIEITEREIEIIEVIERGPVGPTGPQPDINYEVVSSARILEAADLIAADTSGGAFTLTLPANPSNGDAVDIFDFSETFDTNPLTVARNGQPIESLNEDLVANVEGAYFTLIYTGSTRGWQVLPRYGTSGGGGGESTLTTQGDMLYRGVGINTRLPIGSAGQVLKVNSGATAPEWGAAPATGVTSVSGTTPIVSSGGATPAISINPATTSAAGSMSSGDKTKLDAITGTNTGDQTITLTGNVTGSGTGSFAATIANDAVDNTKLSNMAQSTLKGRATASTGDPEDLTASQVRTILNVADGATANTASTATPAALGTAAAGTATAYAREDHVHAMPSAADVGAAAATHASSHAAGGSDPLAPSDIGLGTTDDVTFNSVTATTLVNIAGEDLVATDANGALTRLTGSGIDLNNVRASLELGTAATADSTDFAAASHTHGNLTNDGKLGSTAGLPIVTTTAGAVSTLALGTAGQVLRTKSDLSGVEFADPASSGVTGAAASASDVLGVSGANITGVDANADRIVFWDDSASALKYLEAGSGLSISGTTLSATASGGEVRFDTSSSYTYTGLAAAGTSESTASWLIRRSEFDGAGGHVATLTANNVEWDDRLTASYS